MKKILKVKKVSMRHMKLFSISIVIRCILYFLVVLFKVFHCMSHDFGVISQTKQKSFRKMKVNIKFQILLIY